MKVAPRIAAAELSLPQPPKNISLAGGTLNDIRMLAGHSTLATTQRYIEYNTDAQKKIVEMV